MFTPLRNLCTYRVDDAGPFATLIDPGPDLPLGGIEESIRMSMARADRDFYGGRYGGDALQAYQGACAEIYRYLHPDFPSRMIAGALGRVANLDIVDRLLSASAELARFRGVAASRDGCSSRLVSPVLSPARISVSSSLLDRATMSRKSSPPQPTQSVS
jgi:hypothetical protein